MCREDQLAYLIAWPVFGNVGGCAGEAEARKGAARGRRSGGAVLSTAGRHAAARPCSEQAGVEVDISDFAGGSRALQALVGGSADVVTGAFDHTIQMQAKNQPVVALVELGQFPGFVLALLNAKAAAYRSPADLKGMKIGVTAPGSSTHFMALQLMAKSGLKPDDASFVGVGATTTAVAAVKRGEIDAIVNTDPAVALLQRDGLIKIVADTRTRDGTRDVYGGIYPAAVMYALAGIHREESAHGSGPGERVRARTCVHAKPHTRGSRGRRPRGIRAWRQAALCPGDQEQPPDVFARRPLHPRRRPRPRYACSRRSIPTCAMRRSISPRPTRIDSWRRRRRSNSARGGAADLLDLQPKPRDDARPLGGFAIDIGIVLGGRRH